MTDVRIRALACPRRCQRLASVMLARGSCPTPTSTTTRSYSGAEKSFRDPARRDGRPDPSERREVAKELREVAETFAEVADGTHTTHTLGLLADLLDPP